jgi:hypothetical protein
VKGETPNLPGSRGQRRRCRSSRTSASPEPQTHALREIRSSPPRCSPSPSVHVKRFTVHSGRPPYDLISCHEPCHDGDQERFGEPTTGPIGAEGRSSAEAVSEGWSNASVCVVLMFEAPARGEVLSRSCAEQCSYAVDLRGCRSSASSRGSLFRIGPVLRLFEACCRSCRAGSMDTGVDTPRSGPGSRGTALPEKR